MLKCIDLVAMKCPCEMYKVKQKSLPPQLQKHFYDYEATNVQSSDHIKRLSQTCKNQTEMNVHHYFRS